MAPPDEPFYDRVHYVMMRCEKFAACRGDFNSNSVAGRDQGRPRLSHVRLAGSGKDEAIHHLMHHSRVRLITFD